MKINELKDNQEFLIVAYDMAAVSGALNITPEEHEKNPNIVKLLQQKLIKFCEENTDAIIKRMEERRTANE